jgi:Carboxypeptidase regulatory-like domain/TonB dependent receptor
MFYAFSRACRLILGLTLALAIGTSAGVGGRISGVVTDSSASVVPKASVSITNLATGVRQSLTTDDKGVYSFLDVPVGRYDLEIAADGFKPYQRNGIVVDADASLLLDAVLQVGAKNQTVVVDATAVRTETSSTQLGEVVSGAEMTAVPLNGRSYTDLLALQPGVAPSTSITSLTVQDVGVAALSPSGNLNPGTVAINGQREFANSFIVNGSDSEEDVNNGTAIIPNLDSIAEFRIVTSNFDAEYGEFSGGQINVVTKTGSNDFHGDLFEFLRNTNLDARNYFSPTRGRFDQNQFGGTFGGPLRRNKVFFFADYQGTHLTQGVDTGNIAVPSVAERSGDFSQVPGLVGSTVSGPFFAAQLGNSLGYPVASGEPYFFPGCNTATCVFPGALISQSVWSAPAKNLLQYIPAPNSGANFSTSAFNQTLRDDKGAIRLDGNTRWGMLSAYYFLDDFSQNNPYPVAQGGANVPGFNALNVGRAQLLQLGDTKPFGSTALNEFHFSYLRDAINLGQQQGGVGLTLASQGFIVGPGTPGIVPLSPRTEGVESTSFNSFSIGTNTNQLRQTNNTYQFLDNVSKVIGNHSLKFGGEFHWDQINSFPIAQFNGAFLFFGSETGVDFADFLLGVPSQYNQSQLQPFYGRNKYLGLYAQDSWRIKPNLTLNYGVRWDRIEPWYEKYNQLAVFEPGRQSIVFPNAPAGMLFPTDPGVRRTLAPPGNLDFPPRLGLAYSPSVGSGLLSKITGAPGQTSIRASFGTFYSAIEALTIGVLSANTPYGTTYASPGPPLFATPFITAKDGADNGQAFPAQLAPLGATRKHPNPNVDFSQFEPIEGIPAYPTTNRIPYTEEYMLSIQRALGGATVLSVNYVGTQAHRLPVLVENNPGNPALCLQLANPANLAPGQAPCGPFGEDSVYLTSNNQTINGTRAPFSSSFGSNANQATIGNSNYNALQLTLHRSTRRLDVLAGYTFSKSLDQSSSLGEEVNPVDPALSKAISAFDVRHNFVVSYTYQLPVERLLRAENRWTKGWALAGITHFSSGFPVTLVNNGDNSLLGAEPNGINNFGVDEPDVAPGPLHLNNNPRNRNSYFNIALFSPNVLGTPGTAKRRYFYGPGMENYDLALLKDVKFTESRTLQFRLEGFNVFNHAQFFGPLAVDGNIGDAGSTFGEVVSATAPRLVQLGFKFLF